MRRKIVAITSQYLKEPISQIVSELKLNCDIQVVSYNKFDTISEVYDSYAGDTDGFLISGKIAKAALSQLRTLITVRLYPLKLIQPVCTVLF